MSDELWARVEEVRRAKTRGGGPKNWARVDLLGGLLECVCDRQLRNDGTFADGHRKLYASPCEAWGRKARLGDQIWEAPVLAQVAGITLDDATMAAVVAALGSNHQPVEIDRARIVGRSASSRWSTRPGVWAMTPTWRASRRSARPGTRSLSEQRLGSLVTARSSGCAPLESPEGR